MNYTPINTSSASIVPQSVTMRQARLALLAVGKLDDVEIAIDNLPEPQKSVASIEWDYSSAVERNRELVQVIGQIIGYDNTQLDELFMEAAKL